MRRARLSSIVGGSPPGAFQLSFTAPHTANATGHNDFIHLIRISTDSEINGAVKPESLL
jgi:hypothetical protein